MKVKFCGITNRDDALDAISLGADALGFIFAPGSPRCVTPEQVEEIVFNLPPFVTYVGVFVNQEKSEIDEIVSRCGLDAIQLHGAESPAFCMSMIRPVVKAFKIDTLSDLDPISPYEGMISAALLDTKVSNKDGGTGLSFDWGIALRATEEYSVPIILAGGVTPDNLRKAVQLVRPYAIDACSGIEASPGKKDYNKMKEFLALLRS